MRGKKNKYSKYSFYSPIRKSYIIFMSISVDFNIYFYNLYYKYKRIIKLKSLTVF